MIRSPSSFLSRSRSRARAFSMVELLAVLAIVAVLAVLTLPTFRDRVLQGRRAEARDALLAVQLAQERHRASHPRYADRLEPLDRPATTPSSLYRVRIVHADATSYAIEAKAQGSQASDRRCRVLALRMQAGEIQLTAFDDRGAEQADACWPR